MGRYTGPKNKLSRREGFDLFNKGDKLRRLETPPGANARSGMRRSGSTYQKQLRQKQLAKRLYGLREKQFYRYVSSATSGRGNTADLLIGNLEMRLDNVVYRLGFVPTRAMARQLVTHEHVLVNGKRVSYPSCLVRVGDVVTLKDKIKATPVVSLRLQDKTIKLPRWLSRAADGSGAVLAMPQVADVPEPVVVRDIVEFYSRA